MGKEQVPAAREFTLKPTDIFYSTQEHSLNEYGIACQAIIVRQYAITSGLDSPSPHIIKMYNQEIAEIREKHAIPEEALPFLKNQFDRAVKQQEAIVQEIIPNARERTLARI